MKIDKHIQIVRSDTASLSSMGQQSCDMISDVLSQHYQTVGMTNVSNMADLVGLTDMRPDLIFLGMKNIPLVTNSGQTTSDKVWLSEFLDEKGLLYTGSTASSIALDFDKPSSKRVVREAGLATSSYFMARQGEYSQGDELPLAFPLFVKPPETGGGKGIGADSVIRDFAAFERKVAAIHTDFQSLSLVENYLSGREFSVAILEQLGTEGLIAMPVELITEQNDLGDRILGQKIKAADTEHVIAVEDEAVKILVSELGKDAFRALGARDYGRIDIRLDTHGVPHFLEANLVPGLAHHDFISYFTSACWINRQMDYETMILNIVRLGLGRTIDSTNY